MKNGSAERPWRASTITAAAMSSAIAPASRIAAGAAGPLGKWRGPRAVGGVGSVFCTVLVSTSACFHGSSAGAEYSSNVPGNQAESALPERLSMWSVAPGGTTSCALVELESSGSWSRRWIRRASSDRRAICGRCPLLSRLKAASRRPTSSLTKNSGSPRLWHVPGSSTISPVSLTADQGRAGGGSGVGAPRSARARPRKPRGCVSPRGDSSSLGGAWRSAPCRQPSRHLRRQ